MRGREGGDSELVWWTLEGNIWQSVLKQQPKRRKNIGVQSRTTKSLSIRERLLVMALDILFCFVLIGFGSCNQYNTKCIYHILSRHLIYKLINYLSVYNIWTSHIKSQRLVGLREITTSHTQWEPVTKWWGDFKKITTKQKAHVEAASSPSTSSYRRSRALRNVFSIEFLIFLE